MNKKPLISIVITTKNEAAVIDRLLKSLKTQSYKNYEILLIDNNSSDKTKEIAKKYTKKIFDFGPERSAQRNYGGRISKGEYLLFLDADMKLSKNVLKDCIQIISDNPKVVSIIIPEKSVSVTFMEKVKAFERSFYNIRGYAVTDAARFFKRSVFLKVGGYDETITGPEDWDLPETIQESGYLSDRIKSIIYHYERIPNLGSLFRKKYYYGLKAHKYLKKHKISLVSPKTVYFLRPVFFSNWRKLLNNPGLSAGLFLMLGVELVGGGLGYLIGRIRNL